MHRFLILVSLLSSSLFAAQPNVLLITIDTLRADHMGSYGNAAAKTPNLDALAQNSLFFEKAFCQAPLTLVSHTSLMTGMYPYHHGIHDNAGKLADDKTTLAEILKNNGYHTYAVVGGFPLEHRFGLNQGFDVYDDTFPRVPDHPVDFGTERTADAVLSAAQRIKVAEPFFLWVHFYDAHAPYRNGGYDGEIAFIDRQVPALLKALPMQNTIVAVAGDHGEGLGEHGEFTHRIFLYDSTMRVPFWIKGPGIHPQKVQQQARLIDFVPSLLASIKIESKIAFDGTVLPQNAGKPAILESLFPQLQLGWSPLFAVRTDEWKYVQAPHAELYDLKNDPQETKNRILEKSEIAKSLGALIPKNAATPPKPEISPEMAEQLASLGYVSGNSKPVASNIDPKDRIAVWNDIEKAADLEKSDAAQAIRILEHARQQDPGNPMVLTFLAEKYTETGRLDQARSILTGILKQDPANSLALIRMARLCLKQDKPAEARKYAEALRSSGEGYEEVFLVLAEANVKLGRVPDAIQALNSALKLDPDDAATRIDLANLYMQNKQPANARPEFETVLKTNPDDLQSLNGMATVAFMNQNFAESENLLKRALQLSPNDPQSLMNLALLYGTVERTPEAIRLYKQVVDSTTTPAEWKEQAAARLKELQHR